MRKTHRRARIAPPGTQSRRRRRGDERRRHQRARVATTSAHSSAAAAAPTSATSAAATASRPATAECTPTTNSAAIAAAAPAVALCSVKLFDACLRLFRGFDNEAKTVGSADCRFFRFSSAASSAACWSSTKGSCSTSQFGGRRFLFPASHLTTTPVTRLTTSLLADAPCENTPSTDTFVSVLGAAQRWAGTFDRKGSVRAPCAALPVLPLDRPLVPPLLPEHPQLLTPALSCTPAHAPPSALRAPPPPVACALPPLSDLRAHGVTALSPACAEGSKWAALDAVPTTALPPALKAPCSRGECSLPFVCPPLPFACVLDVLSCAFALCAGTRAADAACGFAAAAALHLCVNATVASVFAATPDLVRARCCGGDFSDTKMFAICCFCLVPGTPISRATSPF
eukprot:6177720-Pleurochrysis_carterae.AAC.3